MNAARRTQSRTQAPRAVCRALGALLACGLLGSAVAAATEDRQAMVLTRAFSYDYALKDRAGAAIVLGIVYKPGNAPSETMADAWIKGFKPLAAIKVQGLPFSAVKIPADNA